jgi:hypothetical protein
LGLVLRSLVWEFVTTSNKDRRALDGRRVADKPRFAGGGQFEEGSSAKYDAVYTK